VTWEDAFLNLFLLGLVEVDSTDRFFSFEFLEMLMRVIIYKADKEQISYPQVLEVVTWGYEICSIAGLIQRSPCSTSQGIQMKRNRSVEHVGRKEFTNPHIPHLGSISAALCCYSTPYMTLVSPLMFSLRSFFFFKFELAKHTLSLIRASYDVTFQKSGVKTSPAPKLFTILFFGQIRILLHY
jgi:hypothetical protein